MIPSREVSQPCRHGSPVKPEQLKLLSDSPRRNELTVHPDDLETAGISHLQQSRPETLAYAALEYSLLEEHHPLVGKRSPERFLWNRANPNQPEPRWDASRAAAVIFAESLP